MHAHPKLVLHLRQIGKESLPDTLAQHEELAVLPSLSTNVGEAQKALDRFADLTRGGDVAFKGNLKRPQCDGIAIGCTWPELQFFPDALGQLLFGNVGVAIRDRLHARPARRVAALPGFPRRHEAFSVWIAVSHSVFLSVLAPIAVLRMSYPRLTRRRNIKCHCNVSL